MKSNLKSSITILRRSCMADAITKTLVANAQGIVIMSIVRGGYFVSGAFGRGIFLKRLANGEWSNPASIGVAQAGVGWQIGIQKEQVVLLLSSSNQVKAFENAGQVTLGGSVALTFGAGASAKTELSVNQKSLAGHSVLSSTQGAMFGFSLDGGVVVSNAVENRHFYNSSKATQKSIFNGELALPRGEKTNRVIALHHALKNLENGRTVEYNLAGLNKRLALANEVVVAQVVANNEESKDEQVPIARSTSFVF